MDSFNDTLFPKKLAGFAGTGFTFARPPENKPTGGYDAETVGKRTHINDFNCSVCKLYLRNPVQIEKCGHNLCQSCLEGLKLSNLEKMFHQQLSCPTCKTPMDINKIFKNKYLERTVLDLKVYCQNRDDGCGWQGELKNLESHGEKDCKHQKRKCPYESIGCTFAGMTMETHHVNTMQGHLDLAIKKIQNMEEILKRNGLR